MLTLECGSGCLWYQGGKNERGVCRFRPPTAGVVGNMEPGLGGMDGMLRAETIWPSVGAKEPGCSQHPRAADAIKAARG